MPSGNKTLGFGVMRGTCTLSYSEAGLCCDGNIAAALQQPLLAANLHGCKFPYKHEG